MPGATLSWGTGVVRFMKTGSSESGSGGHLKIEEFAHEYKIHPETARRRLREGRLRGIKIGSHWRIPVSELARIQAEGGI